VKRREKSDDSIVLQGRRNTVVTVAKRGGKGVTARERWTQLELFTELADSPKGDAAGAEGNDSLSATSAALTSGNKSRQESTRPNEVQVQLELFPEFAESPKRRATRPGGALSSPVKETGPISGDRWRLVSEVLLSRPMTMEEIASKENLLEAFSRVEANKGAPGPDRQSIRDVKEHLIELLPVLQMELISGVFQPGMIRRVWIPKVGGKRGLGIPNVIDRWVQQAIYQVLSLHFEVTFHPSSHGFRPGRSCHSAIEEAKRHLSDGYEYVVDIDLEKFFDRVNHQRLIARLEQKVSDRRIIVIIHRMLKSKIVMPDGVIVSNDEGTPQGGPLSPLLSNIVLDELDRELERRGHRFCRYADDCNIYVRSERSGKRVMASIQRFIEKRLRLRVNTEKSAVGRPEERHFVGFRLCSNLESGGVEVSLSQRSLDRINARIRELTPRNWGNSLRRCIGSINAYLTGWMGFFRICTEGELSTLTRLDAHIRRRLRAIVLKHWKRKRYIARRLISMGVSPKSVWGNLYKGRKSIWALSWCTPVHKGLKNVYFFDLGLQTLEYLWKKHRLNESLAP